MLLNLHIENIAIIDNLDIEFFDGFNVLTGQTGAGKSIIIDSINLLLGNKGSKELISTGKDYALVSAVFCGFNDFQTDFLKQNDVFVDSDGNIVVMRKINADGKNITKINGQTVTVGLLKSIAPVLVQVFGQHDGLKILDTNTHISYLDLYCKNEKEIDEYKNVYSEVKTVRQKIEKLSEIKQAKEQLELSLTFKIEQLEKAKIKVGEYDKLKAARQSCQNLALINGSLYGSDELMNGENGVLFGLSQTIENLDKIKDVVESVSEIINSLNDARAALEDAAAFIASKKDEFEQPEMSADQIEERLYTIEKIVATYGSEQNAIDSLASFKLELDKLNDNENELAQAYEEFNLLRDKLDKKAQAVTESRKKGAKKLCDEITTQLFELDMPKVEFYINIEKSTNARGGTKYTQIGCDVVEFLISANAGQALKPLSKIASGGELSRIMLCLKTALLEKDIECSTFVYDEVDSGVSGATAHKIGDKLKRSSVNKQVFCVTHLAQIAALADHHYKVEKIEKDGFTRSDIIHLNSDQRVEEIARIIGGLDITEQIYKTAKEMIKNS